MSTEKVLARAFADLRSAVPDADAEFAALTSRLDGLERRRPARTAARGVATAGVAAAVAVAATYLPGDHAAPTDHTRAAGSAHQPSAATSRSDTATRPAMRQVAFSSRLATTTGSDGIERPVITVDAGWLPNGAVLDGVGAGRDSGDGGDKRWVVPYPDGAGSYSTQVEVHRGHLLPERCFLCTTSQDLTVNGHPARRLEGDRTAAVNLVVVYLDLGHDEVAYVHTFFETGKLSTADAEAVTDHVARELTFGNDETVPVTARLTAAPAGATIVSAYAGFSDYPMTYYQLNSVDGGAEIGIGNFAEKYPVTTGTPGRDVQGKPSVIIHDAAGRAGLYIKGLYGLFTKLYTGAGAPTLDDLYVIADGIRPVR